MIYKIRKTDNFFDIVNLNEVIFPGELLDVSENVKAWLLYCAAGKPVGFCAGKYIGYGIFYLNRCGILDEAQGHGLHKRLLRVREQYARRNGYKLIITYVAKDNTKSFVNIIKAGYEIYEPEYDYAGKDFINFRKFL